MDFYTARHVDAAYPGVVCTTRAPAAFMGLSEYEYPLRVLWVARRMYENIGEWVNLIVLRCVDQVGVGCWGGNNPSPSAPLQRMGGGGVYPISLAKGIAPGWQRNSYVAAISFLHTPVFRLWVWQI